ncbi:MAG TPA: alpha/beta hydrolase [Acidimicrobiia bacterium]
MHSSSRFHFEGSRRSFLAAVAVALALLLLVAVTPPPADAVQLVDVDVYTDIAYTDPVPETTRGNLLDLYIPDSPGKKKLPLIIWSSGSAWFSDEGKAGAEAIAEVFNQEGYAVAGVSVRSSLQARFPGQLHDIRAAIRWLRVHAKEYDLDPHRVAIMGNSSGGWLAAIAGTTSDIRRLPGETGVGWTSSAVQAAVPFFPPTDFLQMNEWYVEHPEVISFIDHDAPLTPLAPPWSFPLASPESLLAGCADPGGNLLGIQSCPEETQAANPIRYVRGHEVPMLILHGEADPLVPNGQSVLLYEALKGARNNVTFISVTGAGHSVSEPSPVGDPVIGAEDFTVFTSRGGREKVGDRPAPTWENIEHFLNSALRVGQRH